jgi:hypothetical protein
MRIKKMQDQPGMDGAELKRLNTASWESIWMRSRPCSSIVSRAF